MMPSQEQPVPGCVPKPNPTTSYGITEAYTLTDEDKRILANARPAWNRARHQGSSTKRPGEQAPDGRLQGTTADEILAEHGVTWSPGDARYYAMVRALMWGEG